MKSGRLGVGQFLFGRPRKGAWIEMIRAFIR